MGFCDSCICDVIIVFPLFPLWIETMIKKKRLRLQRAGYAANSSISFILTQSNQRKFSI